MRRPFPLAAVGPKRFSSGFLGGRRWLQKVAELPASGVWAAVVAPRVGGGGGPPTDVRKQCDPFPKCARRPGAEDRAPRRIHQVHDG